MMRRVQRSKRSTELQQVFGVCWSAAWVILAFSFVLNVLALTSPLYMLQVYDRVLVTARAETLAMLTIMAALALLIFGVMDGLRSVVAVRMSCWLTDRLGPVFLANGVRARLLGDTSGAQPLRDLAQIQSFIASPGLVVFFDAPWTPVFLILIWLLHPVLGVVAVCSALVLLALGILNEVLTRRQTQAAAASQITAMQQAEATLRNAEVVRSMGMMRALTDRWRASHATSLEAHQSSAERGAYLVGFSKFVRAFVQTAILGMGALLVLRGDVSGGAMIASSILLGRALAPVELAMTSWRNFGLARIAFARLKNRLQAIPPEPERTRLPRPVGYLRVDRVSYFAPGAGRKTPILQDVSFSLCPGEALAVIGPSASGKSTLCRLLVGTAVPADGQIRLDGSELSHFNPEELGAHIGYLPQDVELFSGSVKENIARMGEPDDEAVVDAALLAHAHDMIQRLPHGYDTPIGDAGARLSGGQRQRIGLARAVYGMPRLIILDEPNANLDQAGEAALAAAVQELKNSGAVVLIVGHRPSTLAQVDKVLLLRDGRVEMFGNRDEVVRRLRVAAAKQEPAAPSQPAGGDVVRMDGGAAFTAPDPSKSSAGKEHAAPANALTRAGAV